MDEWDTLRLISRNPEDCYKREKLWTGIVRNEEFPQRKKATRSGQELMLRCDGRPKKHADVR